MHGLYSTLSYFPGYKPGRFVDLFILSTVEHIWRFHQTSTVTYRCWNNRGKTGNHSRSNGDWAADMTVVFIYFRTYLCSQLLSLSISALVHYVYNFVFYITFQIVAVYQSDTARTGSWPRVSDYFILITRYVLCRSHNRTQSLSLGIHQSLISLILNKYSFICCLLSRLISWIKTCWTQMKLDVDHVLATNGNQIIIKCKVCITLCINVMLFMPTVVALIGAYMKLFNVNCYAY